MCVHLGIPRYICSGVRSVREREAVDEFKRIQDVRFFRHWMFDYSRVQRMETTISQPRLVLSCRRQDDGRLRKDSCVIGYRTCRRVCLGFDSGRLSWYSAWNS